MRSKGPPIAKITRPGTDGIFLRRRLFRLIDKGLGLPITWVTGPPGSGKTALIASYIEAGKWPCLWYQIDERDADIASFYYYMGLAEKKASPQKRKPMPLLTSEYSAGIPAFTRRYFEELYLRLNPSPFLDVTFLPIPSEEAIPGQSPRKKKDLSSFLTTTRMCPSIPDFTK